jgi:hypothetical protein
MLGCNARRNFILFLLKNLFLYILVKFIFSNFGPVSDKEYRIRIENKTKNLFYEPLVFEILYSFLKLFKIKVILNKNSSKILFYFFQ